MSYRDWYVGMKIVCVDRDAVSWPRFSTENLPQAGKTYTIREIVICPACNEVGIRLVEIVNKQQADRAVSDANGSKELAFRPRLFRRLASRPTDISIFTAMLDKPKVPA